MMQSLIRSMALAAGAFSALVAATGGVCTGGPWVAPKTTGNPNRGTSFCESNWGTTYVPITNLTVYSSQSYVTGLQALYSDGTVGTLYGTQSTYKVEQIGVAYAFGETFKNVVIYAEGGTIRHLTIKTSTGQVLNVGETVSDLSAAGVSGVSQDIGGGVLYGFLGSYTTAFNSLGFLFLEGRILSLAVTDLTFTNGPNGDEDLTPQFLDPLQYYNSQPAEPYTWNFESVLAVGTMSQFSQGSTQAFANSVSFGISGNFLSIVTVSSGGGFTWSSAYSSATATATTSSTTLSFGASGTLAPSTGVEATPFYESGKGTFAYSSTVTINLETGQSFSYPEVGNLTLYDVSAAYVQVVPDNTPPSNA